MKNKLLKAAWLSPLAILAAANTSQANISDCVECRMMPSSLLVQPLSQGQMSEMQQGIQVAETFLIPNVKSNGAPTFDDFFPWSQQNTGTQVAVAPGAAMTQQQQQQQQPQQEPSLVMMPEQQLAPVVTARPLTSRELMIQTRPFAAPLAPFRR